MLTNNLIDSEPGTQSSDEMSISSPSTQQTLEETGGRRVLPQSFYQSTRPYKRPLLTVPFHHQNPISMTSPYRDQTTTLVEYESLEPEHFFIDEPPPPPPSAIPVDIKEYPIKGVPVKFPFKPYQAQVQMMSKIIEALQKEQHAVLESPTGSGKSLALLCGALAWREKEKEKRMNDYHSTQQVNEMTANLYSSGETRLDTEEFITLMDTMDSQQQSTQQMKRLPRIYVGSRTHKQVTQLVKELKGRTPYRSRMSVLGSRDQYCIHGKVSKSLNKSEDCATLIDTRSCYYSNRTDKLTSSSQIQPGGQNEIWDIEDLVRIGKQVQGCPYYASRTITETADLIFCPYNYLMDPIIRKVMEINTAGNIIIFDEAHNIENIARESGSVEMEDVKLKIIKYELSQIISNGFLIPAHEILFQLLSCLLAWMEDVEDFEREEDNQRSHLLTTAESIKIELQESLSVNATTLKTIIYPAFDLACQHAERKRGRSSNGDDMNLESEQDLDMTNTGNDGVMDPLDEYNDNSNNNNNNQGEGTQNGWNHLTVASLNMIEKLLLILNYVLDDDQDGADSYALAVIENTNQGEHGWKRKFALWCLNPAVVFKELAKDAHSIILTSGTLSPIHTFEAELGVKFPIRLEANHVIQSSQVMVQTIPRGIPLKGVYHTISTTGYQDDIGEAIASICETVPFGILVFANAYTTLNKLKSRWEKTGLLDRIKKTKHFMLEPRGKSPKEFNRTLKKFYAHIKKAENGESVETGAVLLAVYRGKISEGIDFTDNNCRAVIATGIPFPMWQDTKVQLKRSYNDSRRNRQDTVLSGDEWYNIQAYRAINQALGRCIRHRNDWGAILLLEERFLDSRNTQQLSKWIRRLCSSTNTNFDSIMTNLQQFVTRHRRIKLENQQSRQQEQQQSQNVDIPNIKGDEESLSSKDQTQETSDTLQQPGRENKNDIEKQSQHLSQLGLDHLKLDTVPTVVEDGNRNDGDKDTDNTIKQEIIHQGVPSAFEVEQQHVDNDFVSHPTTSVSSQPVFGQQMYIITCRKCSQSIFTRPASAFAFRSMTTDLYHFHNIAQQDLDNSQQKVYFTSVLVLNEPSLWHPSETINNENWISSPVSTSTRNVQWNPMDKIVYESILSPCCRRQVGAHIITTTIGTMDSNIPLIGKILLVKDLVEVTSRVA
ncbi:helicase C-terminal domain-containing protein [Halteromyces radiatus]|uniref:helicase C-terminal domain-containing protein n=1 Tax=Halteromyces radiatus TaxID=101107 RepID=UPI0022205D58|nr:helicase C-terminal domain-containing protein [Halteromyces radiatus]KAI8089536.1 helicase C-terminal domain-containing protein [Halteromyces radiatus]